MEPFLATVDRGVPDLPHDRVAHAHGRRRWLPLPLVRGLTAVVLGAVALAGGVAGGLGLRSGRRLRALLPDYRMRRLLLSRWRRLTRWEFWPMWAFYPPVLVYVALLMARHRSLTLFTAANPGIPASGFVGESKFDILRRLSGAQAFVARAELIPGALDPESKHERARAFMTRHDLRLPVVLKPDQGQRGSGVVIVRSDDALEDALRRSSLDTILQEYVPGAEFGVFYCRRPSERKGWVFSVTEKRFPTVTGDGRRTLEDLILADDRAVCLAPRHLQRHRHHLQRVPRAGERVPLVELGTHCKGALFLDGRNVLTPALVGMFDEIAAAFDGFFFGRFDVRTASVDDFRAGKNFKIVELNGVTSEATHIYDPSTGLLAAYRVLFEQWRIAFDIAAENRARGTVPTPLRALVRLALDYRRAAERHLAVPLSASASM